MDPEERQFPPAPDRVPANRAELRHAIDRAGDVPAGPAWRGILDRYLTWNPTCHLGLAAYAHVLEHDGETEEALSLYRSATAAEPDLPLPPLRCLRKPEPERKKRKRKDEPEAEEDPHRQAKLTSLIAAIGIHVLLVILFSIWAVSQPKVPPPQIVASSLPEDEVQTSNRERLKRDVVARPSLAANHSPVISSAAISDVALPQLPTETLNANPQTIGMSFAPSLGFGGQGGEVAFFGSKAKAHKVVYVVDVSGSMYQKGELGKSRLELMKEELKRSLSALPSGVYYQVIFFSSFAWFAGTEINEVEMIAKFGKGVDADNLPSEPLIRAVPSRIRETLEHIDAAESMGGTNWRLPLKMAIKLEPDVIYFLTDGEIDSDTGDTPVIQDVVEYNRKHAQSKINSICLMELKAFEMLRELSTRTRGEVFLVKENGEVVRGLQLNMLE